MRTIIFLFLSISSMVSYASCELTMARIGTETLFINIQDEGCANDKYVISFATKQREEKEFENYKTVPFLSECSLTKDGFKCRSNGKTPLAGATYKKINFGRSGNSCAPDSWLGEKYICVKGCSKVTVPEYLIGDEGSC